jgi:two-component system, chemotaxis family, chemotaxis protein CheY
MSDEDPLMDESQLILVVEDDRDIRETMTDALEQAGYQVVEAADGVDALERLRGSTRLPGLILLDLMMPRMNGVEFCEEKRKIAEWAAIPTVVLSADAQVKQKAEACRATSYLKKPVKLDVLYEAVTRAFAGVGA